MKKNILYSLLLAILLITGCKNEDEVDSATGRYEAWIAQCKTTLVGSQTGWRFDYDTPTGKKTTFLLNFYENNWVKIIDMNNSDVQDSCMYSFNRAQGPILVLCSTGGTPISDLAAYKSGNTGDRGDIEFIILDIKPDTILLKGRKNQDLRTFTEIIVGERHRINFTREMDVDLRYGRNFFHILRYNGNVADIALGEDKESIDLTLSEGNTVNSKITYTETGFNLNTPLNFAGEMITNFVWNVSTKGFLANGLIKLESTNIPQYSVGETAGEVIGNCYDIDVYSLSVENWIWAVERAFPNLKRHEIYLDTKVLIETRTVKVEKADTILISSSEQEFDAYISNSYIFKEPKATAENWNNFRGSQIETLRSDRMRMTASMREGNEVSALNVNASVRNINGSFYHTSGHTIVMRNNRIYLVSSADSKNWIALKKRDGIAKQIIVHIVP